MFKCSYYARQTQKVEPLTDCRVDTTPPLEPCIGGSPPTRDCSFHGYLCLADEAPSPIQDQIV